MAQDAKGGPEAGAARARLHIAPGGEAALGPLRERIIADPALILDDDELMRALVEAHDRRLGGNIVDLRGIAMERLEERLDRLEDTNRSVIAAAYENLAGTAQIHRAVLALLDHLDFAGLLEQLAGEVAAILRVDGLRLVIESEAGPDPDAPPPEPIRVARPGEILAYISGGRDLPPRKITLRQVAEASDRFFGEAAEWVRSEAMLRLDLGEAGAAMLLLGSEDPHQFRPSQGTDLLEFFAGVLERELRRWLT